MSAGLGLRVWMGEDGCEVDTRLRLCQSGTAAT